MSCFCSDLRRLPKGEKAFASLFFFTEQRLLDCWKAAGGEKQILGLPAIPAFVPACRFFDAEALVQDKARERTDIFFCCEGCPDDCNIPMPGMRHGNMEHDLIVQRARYFWECPAQACERSGETQNIFALTLEEKKFHTDLMRRKRQVTQRKQNFF